MAYMNDSAVDEGLALTMPDGTEVEVLVHEIRGAKVRLRVHAPRAVTISPIEETTE